MIVGLAFGRFLVCIFLCPGCGLVIGFVCFPGLWGFAWLFCWLYPYAGVGCTGFGLVYLGMVVFLLCVHNGGFVSG